MFENGLPHRSYLLNFSYFPCSGSCRQTFGLSDRAPIVPGKETMAQCTREFSDISPLTGGNIVFSTLEGRPSAENFEESEVLQEWVTATEIMVGILGNIAIHFPRSPWSG